MYQNKHDEALAELQKAYDNARNDGEKRVALFSFRTSLSLIEKSTLAKEIKENAALIHHYNIARVFLVKGDLAGAMSETEKFRKGEETRKNKNQIRLGHELSGMIAFHQKDYGKADEAKKYATWAAKYNVLPFMNYAYVRMKAEKLLAAL